MHLPTAGFIASALLAHTATAKIHHLFTGGFGSGSETARIYSLEFDDEALTLQIANNISAETSSNSWIAFDYQKKNLYASSSTGWSSYTVVNGTSLSYDTFIEMGGNCSSTKAIFIAASPDPPYNVYGTPFGGDAYCGNVISVDENGVLSDVIQNYTYSASSGVHGLAFNPKAPFLYSADDSGNSVWTHKIDSTTGKLEYVARVSGAESGADPRHMTVHPNGRMAYVVYEGTNKIALYSINQKTHTLSFTNVTYPLVPSGSTDSDYWSDEVALSFSNSYLWATSRGRSTGTPGYISAFKLESSGAVQSQLLLEATTTSGGTANSVAPSDFSDEFVALTDTTEEFVQIWRFNGTDADIVAQVNITDSGCCANAVWYD